MIWRFIGGLIGFSIFFALLFLALAVAVYVYPSFWGLLFIVALWEALLYFVLIFSPLALFSSDASFRSSTLAGFTAVPLVYIANNYMLYLAETWRVVPSDFVKWILTAPNIVLDAVLTFFQEFSRALFGIEFNIPLPDAPAMPSAPDIIAVDASPIVWWLLDSGWNLVLGVLSGVVTAMIWRRRSA